MKNEKKKKEKKKKKKPQNPTKSKHIKGSKERYLGW